jgi:predicted MPP superfamily phosphohydrolase
MLRLGAAGLLALGLRPRRLLGAEAADEKFTFIAVNDLHFREVACRPWFEKVVAQMKQSASKAEFCLLGGDLADQGTPAQLTGIRDAFAKLEIPVHVVVGNHDYIAGSNRLAYERIFPGQINYHFEHRGWQVIGLDTSEGTKSQNTMISDVTLRWLDENLPRLDRTKPTILFTHFPLGNFVWRRPINASAVLERLASMNVQAIFSGHFHGFTERRFGQAVLTTDRCCARIRNNHDGTKEKGWFLCQAAQGGVSRRFVEFRA